MFNDTEEEERFTTLVYAAIDPQTGAGVISNAGHPLPLLITPDAPARLSMSAPDAPLGSPSHRTQTEFLLPPAGTLMLYSDGLLNNRQGELDAGLEKLLRAVDNAPAEATADLESFVNLLIKQMLAGYDQRDDVALLAVRRAN
jgi:serine phosphatase RsbU (regulator of sigma subunit)